MESLTLPGTKLGDVTLNRWPDSPDYLKLNLPDQADQAVIYRNVAYKGEIELRRVAGEGWVRAHSFLYRADYPHREASPSARKALESLACRIVTDWESALPQPDPVVTGAAPL